MDRVSEADHPHFSPSPLLGAAVIYLGKLKSFWMNQPPIVKTLIVKHDFPGILGCNNRTLRGGGVRQTFKKDV